MHKRSKTAGICVDVSDILSNNGKQEETAVSSDLTKQEDEFSKHCSVMLQVMNDNYGKP